MLRKTWRARIFLATSIIAFLDNYHIHSVLHVYIIIVGGGVASDPALIGRNEGLVLNAWACAPANESLGLCYTVSKLSVIDDPSMTHTVSLFLHYEVRLGSSWIIPKNSQGETAIL